MDQFTHLLRGKVFGPEIGVDIGLFENALGSRGPDSINIRKGGFDAFVAGNFNT